MRIIKRRTKKRKKITMIVTFASIYTIISIFFTRTNVKAGIQDSTLVKNRIEGVYAIAPLSDKTHLYYLQKYTLNGKISYCIELGKPITTEIYNSTTNINDQEEITNLSREKLEYIKALAYFGYGYQGNSNDKYYMATQELIWEYINNIDITWTTELDINGPKIDIENIKNEIKNLAQRYITTPAINNHIRIKVGEQINIQDTNNSLQFYEKETNTSHQININNNSLEIKPNNQEIGYSKIKLKRKKYYDYQSTIYNFENSQILLSIGNLEDLTKEIDLEVVGTNLKVNLVDKDTKSSIPSGQASLIGAEYIMYRQDGKYIAKFTMGKSLASIICNLGFDEYYIVQVKASPGYKLNEERIKLSIDTTNNKELTLEEEVIKSNIEINKLYEFENENKREKNITFEIYDNNNNLFKTITTTEYGPDVVTLPYGYYIIKQINTTYGYKKIDDIELNIDEESNTNIKYNLLDEKIKVPVHITTINAKTKEKILESNIKYKIKNKITGKYIDYNKIDEFMTNEVGELTLPFLLPYGVYILEQISVPTNYIDNIEHIEFTINDKTEYTYRENEIVVNINYENEPIRGKINITTKEEIITIKNNELKKEEVIRPNQKIELYNKNNELIDTYETNNKGNLVLNDLDLEKYCVKDLEANKEKCVELTNNENKVNIIEKDLIITKEVKTININIKNLDIYGNAIEGTIIEFYQNDNLAITTMTNEEGLSTIKNVEKGIYCIKEKKISEKYLINNNKECIQIDDLSEDNEIIITNKLKSQNTSNPKTSDNILQYVLILLVSITGIIYIIKSKKTKH